MGIQRRVLVLAGLCILHALALDGPARWVPTWVAAPQPYRALADPTDTVFENQTIRMVMRSSVGGSRLRVQFSNAHGTTALVVGAAHVALRFKDSEVVPGSDRVLLFGGKPAITIPPGAHVVSDPVSLAVPPARDLAISLYVPQKAETSTMHSRGLHTTYVSKAGNFSGEAAILNAQTTLSYYWLSGVEVLAPTSTPVIVALGDSITDGTSSTPNMNRNWPSVLADRLLKNPATANLAVVNEGIGGNRIVRDVQGTNALARLDRDVFSLTGVTWLIFLEGINDIGRATGTNAPSDGPVTLDDLIAADQQIVAQAHAHGIKVMGATLTPYAGAAYYSEAGEAVRTGLNKWILTSGVFDATVDFDAAVRDPARPGQIRADFNISDHLHPNDAGYKAMGEAIDLQKFALPIARK